MKTNELPIHIPKEQIAELCKRYNIAKLSLFGSVLRDDFTPESDVDFLVEFKSEDEIGFFELMTIKIELSNLIGREVDLRTPDDLSMHFRQEVIDSSLVQYVQN